MFGKSQTTKAVTARTRQAGALQAARPRQGRAEALHARQFGQSVGADLGATVGAGVGTALGVAAEVTGPLRERFAESAPGLVAAAQRAGSSAAELGERAREGAGPALASAAELAGRAREGAGPALATAGELAGRARESAGPALATAAEAASRARESARPALASAVERAGPAFDDARVRSTAAWDALRGERVGPPAAVRRWPWAVGAAVAGAVLAGLVAALLRRVNPPDPLGAQEAHEVEAVVDRPIPVASETSAVAAEAPPMV